MKKIATIIILSVVASIYFFVFKQNSIPACNSAQIEVDSLVKNILGQVSSQKDITYKISNIQETKVHEHSRVCKAQLNFKDGTNTSISYAVENNKLGKIEVRIIPGG
ncbi:hypothetical protein [Francisella adeliensis]|uniref:Uncharacterized protein n=1 Tax=Francisella adeliensis TaxID=2007306 RepID=A0A2Z4XZZ2_9GAMM|nr:hypothetical protein [Francisella adeliensis]AXA34360.1 hypothetical protein CDH04_08110 [Francisella adeliensis]MBK2086447.1 hypothetical protein [Francisella adeliensis]MBK2096075.1 hypothetical protein [Francisella adeliensis]QIW12607.1 hypothetical protein FZC43_08115 [Francisella adeliensis]QIW14480.1 hypothetical protein FZC44_08110 [Francisella adeliensis]